MNANVSDYNINYIEEGNGDLVVLLHGWGTNHKSFLPLVNLLKCKYRVIALDLPGFGESDSLKKPFAVDDYAILVAKFIGQKCNCSENVVLIGHSYGGRIIIKLNSRDDLPFKINKNILIDAAGIIDKRDLMSKVKISLYKTIKTFVNFLPVSDLMKNNIINKYRNKFGSSDYNNASNELRQTLINSVNEDLTPYLKDMKETLLIWGDKDTATPVYMAKIMEKEIENSGLVMLKGGHFSFIDDQYTFLSVIKSYLKI